MIISDTNNIKDFSLRNHFCLYCSLSFNKQCVLVADSRKSNKVRSSHRRCFIKEVFFFKNFPKFTGEQLRWSIFFNKVAGLTLLKRRLQHRCFPVNFAIFLRTPFLQNTFGGCFCTNFHTVNNTTQQRNNILTQSIKERKRAG